MVEHVKYLLFDEYSKDSYLEKYNLFNKALIDIKQNNRTHYEISETYKEVILKYMKQIYQYNKCDYVNIRSEIIKLQNLLNTLIKKYQLEASSFVLNNESIELNNLKEIITNIKYCTESIDVLKQLIQKDKDTDNLHTNEHNEHNKEQNELFIKLTTESNKDVLKKLIHSFLEKKLTLDKENLHINSNLNNTVEHHLYCCVNKLPTISIEQIKKDYK